MRLIAAILLACSAGQEAPRPAFFKREVDFFGAKSRPKPPDAPLWDGDKPPPAPVRELLERPSAESARRYLEWQRRRLEQLALAIRAVEEAQAGAAKAEPANPGILYFTREGCAFCVEQDKRLEGLDVKRIRPGESPELWARHRVDATPTLVVRGKVLRGLQSREQIDQALKEEQP